MNLDHHQRFDCAISLMKYASSIHEPASNHGTADQEDLAIAPRSGIDKRKQEPGRWQRIAGFMAEPRNTLRFITVIALAILIAGGSCLAVMDNRLRRTFDQMQAQH